jgi:hypothetical protein
VEAKAVVLRSPPLFESFSACCLERSHHIAEEAPDAGMLMFVDEAAKDEHTISWRYGHSAKGAHYVVQRQFVRGVHYLIIPVITLDGVIAYNIVDGPIDGEHFLKFIKNHVVTTHFFRSHC